jgi:ribosome-binding ATPase YchF (GTP1/OBG family)
MLAIVSRISDNCTLVISGDDSQRDVRGKSGLSWFTEFAKRHSIQGVGFVNVDEDSLADGGNKFVDILKVHAAGVNADVILLCAKIEEELVGLEDDEATEFLADLGVSESGLEQIIHKAFDKLGLQSYFTAGKIEVRAWTIRKNTKAPQAAAVIHNDFEKGFIKAEVIAYEDFVNLGGEAKCKEAGKLRLEGKDYVVQDGDIMHFRFNV